MIRVTYHARAQLEERAGDFITPADLHILDALENDLTRGGETHVILRRMSGVVSCPDGSTGDMIVASVHWDGYGEKVVATIMFRGSWQKAHRCPIIDASR